MPAFRSLPVGLLLASIPGLGDAARKRAGHSLDLTKQLPAAVANAQSPHEIMLIQCPDPVLTSLDVLKGEQAGRQKYNQIKRAVIEHYDSLSDVCDGVDCEQGDFAGCVLRMAGHDFMDFENGLHGSDGCIDFEDVDNKGLKPCLGGAGEFNKGATVSEIYKDFCHEVSLADFFIIVAESVMVRSRPDYNPNGRFSPSLNFRNSFKFGRTTATSCTFERHLPDPEDGCHAVQQTFVTQLGLSWRESAALMGVHALGKAQPDNSGYDGFWTSPPQSRIFDTHYYRAMQVGWVAKRAVGGNPNKNQWIRTDLGPATDMMLDSDLCLFFGTREIAAADRVGCVWSSPVGWQSPAGPQTSPCVKADGTTPGADATTFGDIFRSCCEREGGAPPLVAGAAPRRRRFSNPPGTQTLSGFFGASSGPAAVDVAEFARDEAQWLNVFKEAWHKATETHLIEPTPAPAPVAFSTDCAQDGNCITSSNFPSSYDDDESCSITGPAGTTITTDSFNTESGFDKLIVDGQEFDGQNGPGTITFANNFEITWSSDGSVARSGWKLCLG